MTATQLYSTNLLLMFYFTLVVIGSRVFCAHTDHTDHTCCLGNSGISGLLGEITYFGSQFFLNQVLPNQFCPTPFIIKTEIQALLLVPSWFGSLSFCPFLSFFFLSFSPSSSFFAFLLFSPFRPFSSSKNFRNKRKKKRGREEERERMKKFLLSRS